MLKKNILNIIRIYLDFFSWNIIIGAIFIFSAYTKLYPIEPFEYTFVDLGIGNWQMAPFIARFLIGLEFLIGFALIFHIFLKKITYKLSIAILLFFCVYLLLQIFISGNKGNCGCFGSSIAMTPLQALIKNIVMLVILGLLYKFYDGRSFALKYSKLAFTLVTLSSFSLPFILNVVELDYSEAYLNKPEENFDLPLDTLYNHATMNVPPRTLSNGKHILVFMSLTCPHCRIAAKKIKIIHQRNPEIPFYFVLNGDDSKLKPFYDDTHTEDIPFCKLHGKPFIYLAGTNMPVIYLLNNSKVEHDLDYISLDQGELEEWLKK
jgi:hypothetical protein